MDLYLLEEWLSDLLAIPPHQKTRLQRNCLAALNRPIAKERERLSIPRKTITVRTGHACGHRVEYRFQEWRTEVEENAMRQACYEYALVPCQTGCLGDEA